MLHPPEPLECSVEDAPRGAAADVGDDADAAGITFARAVHPQGPPGSLKRTNLPPVCCFPSRRGREGERRLARKEARDRKPNNRNRGRGAHRAPHSRGVRGRQQVFSEVLIRLWITASSTAAGI